MATASQPDEPARSVQQRGPVALYGATGYTGRLVAAELAARGVEMMLAGRDEAKLTRLATAVGDPPVAAVGLDDSRGLREMLEPCAAVISCAGPFSVHGEPVVRAAVEASTSYLDSTGEQPFMRRIFDVHGPGAERAGIALVTAMGFDYVPGDMIASLTAADLDGVEDVSLAYAVQAFGPTRGTATTAIGQLAEGDYEWRDGELVAGSSAVRQPDHDFGGGIGRQRMTRYPAGEQITVPRHVPTRNIHTSLTAATTSGHPRLAPLAGVTMPVIQAALKTPAKGLIERLVGRLPEGPAEEDRRRARFRIECEVRAPGELRRGWIAGTDVYGLTAVLLAEGALRLAAPGYGLSGALAPSQAFEPVEFLGALAPSGVTYEVGV